MIDQLQGKVASIAAVTASSTAGVAVGWGDIVQNLEPILQAGVQGSTIIMLWTVILLNLRKVLLKRKDDDKEK